MIGIIGAMEVEINVIKEHISNVEIIEHPIRTFYKGQVHNQDVVLVLAGIGKTNAAITTTVLLEHFDVDYIINVGVAGGQNGVHHKDVVISTEVLYHDVDVTRFSTYSHGQVPGHEPTFIADKTLLTATDVVLSKLGIPHKKGRIASGDQFVYSVENIAEVNALYNDIYAVEMEACAIAHTASVYNVPFIIYRSISDVLDDENQADDFYKFVEEASNQAATVLLELLKEFV